MRQDRQKVVVPGKAALMATTVLCVPPLLQAADTGKAVSVTFSKDVAPILYKSCVNCHRPGSIAPMSLLTYSETRPWAASIRNAVKTGRMPPWNADPNVNTYANDPRLGQDELDVLIAWTNNGAPEGNPRDLPRQPTFQDGWTLGQPDAVFAFPQEQTISSSEDEYVNIEVPTNFTEDKWVQAVEIKPGNRKIVHHATVSIVPPAPSGRQPTRISSVYTYRKGNLEFIRPDVPVVNDGCAFPDGGDWPGTAALHQIGGNAGDLGSFLPGRGPDIRPEGYAVLVPAGSMLNFQMHYTKTNKAEKDRSSIGLYLLKVPMKAQVHHAEIWNRLFEIPPGASNHEVTSCSTVDHDVEFMAYTAHMHFRGTDMTSVAIYPDGSREKIFAVPHYSFNWQQLYTLKAPKFIPKGTVIRTTAHFDNSPNNPQNPDPSEAVRWGQPSKAEMMGFWVDFIDASNR
jgi:hypothetical protein